MDILQPGVIGNSYRCPILRLISTFIIFLIFSFILLPVNALAEEADAPPDPAPVEWFDAEEKASEAIIRSKTDATGDGESEMMLAYPITPASTPPTVPVDQDWVAQGPAPVVSGQVEHVTPNNEVSGAIHTIVVHPSDPDIYWIGTVNGGIMEIGLPGDFK